MRTALCTSACDVRQPKHPLHASHPTSGAETTHARLGHTRAQHLLLHSRGAHMHSHCTRTAKARTRIATARAQLGQAHAQPLQASAQEMPHKHTHTHAHPRTYTHRHRHTAEAHDSLTCSLRATVSSGNAMTWPANALSTPKHSEGPTPGSTPPCAWVCQCFKKSCSLRACTVGRGGRLRQVRARLPKMARGLCACAMAWVHAHVRMCV